MSAPALRADTRGRYAVISMRLGSGIGMATLIENLWRRIASAPLPTPARWG